MTSTPSWFAKSVGAGPSRRAHMRHTHVRSVLAGRRALITDDAGWSGHVGFIALEVITCSLRVKRLDMRFV